MLFNALWTFKINPKTFNSSTQPKGLIGLGTQTLNHSWGDMIFLPSQDCLSLSNLKLGCCKMSSPSQVASSLGSHTHCTKYSLMILILNIFSLTSNILFGTKKKCTSSSNGGIYFEIFTCFPITFFKQDKWRTLWILPP